jgi:two-component system, cell cycle sensor histidine kinase and response regulator CckA
MAKETLTLLGYRVNAMSSPEDALALFKLNPGSFNVVITDMAMPKMTGITLAEKLFKIRPDIPVIVCTGHSPMIDEEKAEQLGFAGYFAKPVTMTKIVSAIRKIIDQPV